LDDESLPDSDNHFFPTSEWPAPSRVKTEDLLGNERKVVTDALEMFDEPSKMK
jgi:casein kinase I family protein HRR25